MGKYSRYKRKQYKKYLFNCFSNRCPYCFCIMRLFSENMKNVGTVATFDHVIALSVGGTNKIDNLIICCAKCNNRKGNQSLIQYLKSKKLQTVFQKNLIKYE